MGRAVPAYGNVSIDHILLSYAFFAAGVAATLSIIIAMCGLIGRKEEEPTTDNNNKENPNNKTDQAEGDKPAGEGDAPAGEGDAPAGELPLPPGNKLRGSQSSVLRSNSEIKQTLTTKNIRVSMSMRKAKPSMTDINIHKNNEKNVKRDDSIWMKPIILGEKCRVPGNATSEGDSNDPAIIKVDGSIASTNFRNHSRQFTISRNNEFVEKNVGPSPTPSS